MRPAVAKVGFVFVLILFGCLIASRGLNEPDEGRYTEIAREMLTTGDYLVPRLKGVPHFAKPPMTYWCIAYSMKFLGISEFAARLPGFLCAVLTFFLIRDLARRMGSELSPWLTFCIVASTIEFFTLAQIVTTDMLLCFFVVLAMCARWRIWESDEARKKWQFLFWLAVAGGVLTKGPIILMVVFAGLGANAVLEGSWRPLRQLGAMWGLPLALALSLPWFVIMIVRQPELADFFYGDEFVERLRSGRGRAKPFYYFLIVFPLVLLPWTAYILKAAVKIHRRNRRSALFLFGWIVGPFLIFSASSSKLWTYVLPLVPPAILVLLVGSQSVTIGQRRRLLAVSVVSLVLLVAAVFLAEEKSLELGNNAGYRKFYRQLREGSFVGQPIGSLVAPQSRAPEFSPRVGIRIATYRFRCPSAAFYLLGLRPEFIPTFGNKSLWELQSRKDQDRPGTLKDLVSIVSQDREIIILSKTRYQKELEEACGRQLRIVARSGSDDAGVVALTNQ